MSCSMCERVEKTRNKTYGFLIHEFKNSFLYLGEHQYYSGYCLLVSKDHYREMTDIPKDIQAEIFQEMMKSHEVIQKIFKPKKMNMCSLGNVTDHIHWHFFPRYENDENFKNPPWLQMHLFDSAKVTDDEREKLIKLFKTYF